MGHAIGLGQSEQLRFKAGIHWMVYAPVPPEVAGLNMDSLPNVIDISVNRHTVGRVGNRGGKRGITTPAVGNIYRVKTGRKVTNQVWIINIAIYRVRVGRISTQGRNGNLAGRLSKTEYILVAEPKFKEFPTNLPNNYLCIRNQMDW